MNTKIMAWSFVAAGISLAACSNDDNMQSDKGDNEVGIIQRIEVSDEEQQAISYFNNFGWRLYQQVISDSPQENAVISPLSISLAISMLANGAEGVMLDEIMDVLGLEDVSLDALNSMNSKLANGLETVDSNVKLSLANSMWYRKSVITPYDAFVEALRDNYNAEVVGFEGVPAKLINSWIEQKTNGLIKDLLRDDYDNSFSLVNAAYFKGMWTDEHKFDPKKTKQDKFHDYAGTTSTGEFMENTASYYYAQTEATHHLGLAMGSESNLGNETFRLNILLPKEGCTLQQSINEMITQKAPFKYTNEVILRIPKFEVGFEGNIVEDLKQIGLEKTFLEACTGIADVPIFFDCVIHGATMKIDEEGAEGAAATVIGGETSAGGIEYSTLEITLVEPFVYYITESTTGAILFIGHIAHL